MNHRYYDKSRNILAQKLRDVRLETGISQLIVSLNVDISQPNLSQMEIGRRKPTQAELERLAEYYEVDVELFKE